MATYRRRLIESKIRTLARYFKVVLLTGARQVGKSTVLMELFPDMRVCIFDPVHDTYNVKRDAEAFIENFPAPLILDEIQYAPELLPALKRKVDERGTPGQYYITGSQQLSILQSMTESLAGRVAIVPLGPMTPQEMYGDATQPSWLSRYLADPHNFARTAGGAKLLETPPLYHAIWRGGMPGVLEVPNDVLPTYFLSYLQTYVERDVRMLENIQDAALFGRFVALLGALTAQEMNYAQLGRDLGLSPSTAQRWLQLLIHTYQWYDVWPYHGNTIKRISKKPKGFFTDSGFACYLQRISSPQALAGHPLLGALFETFCYTMIRGSIAGLDTPPLAYHWRSSGGAEVDLVLEQDGMLYPIEMKCTSNVSASDCRGIRAFRETYPDAKIAPGIVLYGGKVCMPIDGGVAIAVPWNVA